MDVQTADLRRLEELDYVEDQWDFELKLLTDKIYPEGFPHLPPIPIGRYVDPGFFELEKQQMWSRTWFLAGFASELPGNGSFKAFEFLGRPIVLVRGRDGDIRAFHNVCQHRGARLCYEPSGKIDRFRCIYHSWTYELDGALAFIPNEHEFPHVDRQERSLTPLRCEGLGGLIFVNFDLDAEPLDSFFAQTSQLMADVPLDKAELYRTLSWEVNCNWKGCNDNFNETYHIPFTHKDTVHETLDYRCHAKYMFDNGHNVMITKARGGEGAGIYKTVKSVQNPLKPVTNFSSLAYSLFPNLVMPVAANVFSIIQAVPLDVGRTQMNLHILKIQNDGLTKDEHDALCEDAITAFLPVVEEDVFMLGDIHASMSGGGITSTQVSYAEQFVYNHQQHLDQVIGSENVPEHLRITPVDLPIAGLRKT
jgi:phenylpropionate dioxygenase-like ring-hydroxylating dioxygenase large terminal subunit